jgi:hypothetical protein
MGVWPLAFERMDSVRPASADLAIGKARAAARLQRPTAEIEDNINQGRTAFVTANIPALRGGFGPQKLTRRKARLGIEPAGRSGVLDQPGQLRRGCHNAAFSKKGRGVRSTFVNSISSASVLGLR